MNLKKQNNRGAALLQVLILSAILAGMATMILRVTLSRSVASKQVRHQITAQKMIESCMAQVNMFWASKTPEAYARDLGQCQMCDPTKDGVANGGSCPQHELESNFLGRTDVYKNHIYDCGSITGEQGTSRNVYAVISGSSGNCQIEYVIPNGVEL